MDVGDDMAAIALFRGPYHVMEWCNEELLELFPRDGRGIPVREAFPEEAFRDAQTAMDDCFHSGRYIKLDRPIGVLWLCPRRDDRGRVYGVASHFQPSPIAAPRLTLLPEHLKEAQRAG